jgi:hypothetical protein
MPTKVVCRESQLEYGRADQRHVGQGLGQTVPSTHAVCWIPAPATTQQIEPARQH